MKKYKLIPISKMDSISVKKEIVYDIEVENNHSFCVTKQNIIVHNSGCLTQYKTGVGQGTISSIVECADAAHGLDGHVCADGGIKSPGDAAKAFGAGADFIMIGGFFCGVDENNGEWIYNDKNEKVKFKYYGMSSEQAMMKYYKKIDKYKTSEGKVIETIYKGSVKNLIQDILGGLRSTGTYIGAKNIKDFPKCTTFIKVV